MNTSHFSPRGIHWIEEGSDATPLVLLHGLGGDAKFWAAEQAKLSKIYRTIAIDLRGSGLSARAMESLSIASLVEDILDVLDASGIENADIIGFSMGGVVAQALALAAPQRTKRLVLAGTFATMNVQARLYLQAVGAQYRQGATPEQMYSLILPWLFSIPFLSSPDAQPFLSYVQDPLDQQTREDWLRLLQALLDYEGVDRLEDIQAPTLILYGSEDRLASSSDAEIIRSGITKSVLKVVPGGHLFNIESPDVFLNHIVSFLSND